ncbi:AbrB/MazE/SpoVT family DNA-binding domain-containing protein [Candidatus Saccharibacteria bacterium]|nr:AbrB/MazE/SpoVT family DNA-binding domain-containing protein [Candidatus Saccharibacteria bacterium]
MSYAVVINSSGQITLPKAIRDVLGVKIGDRVKFDIEKEEVKVSRVKDIYEVLAEIDAERTPEERARIKAIAGKTVHELMDEWDNSEEAAIYYKEKYGV